MKATAYFAASLDGYIARSDGSIDWLNEASAAVPDGEDLGFKDFLNSVDAIVMGRKTFEQALTFGEWAYGKTPVYVMSSKPISIPPVCPKVVCHSSESPQAIYKRLKAEGLKHIYVDGGVTIKGFLAAGLINEIIVTTIPVILGSGISPFAGLTKDIMLALLATESFDCGFVQIKYAVTRKA